MGHVITFAQHKGGAGKTTLAAHVVGRAADLQVKGPNNVVLCDADPQRHAAQWVEAASPDVQVERFDDEDQLLRNVRKVAQDQDPGIARTCVVDLPGGDQALMRSAMLVSDLVVMPVGNSMLDLESLTSTMETLELARQIRGSEYPHAMIVPMRTKKTKVSQEVIAACQQLAETMQMLVVLDGIPDRTKVSDAYGQRAYVWDIDTDGLSSAHLQAACDYIIHWCHDNLEDDE